MATNEELMKELRELDRLIRGGGRVGDPGLADAIRANRIDIDRLLKQREKTSERIWQWIAIVAGWLIAMFRDVLFK